MIVSGLGIFKLVQVAIALVTTVTELMKIAKMSLVDGGTAVDLDIVVFGTKRMIDAINTETYTIASAKPLLRLAVSAMVGRQQR